MKQTNAALSECLSERLFLLLDELVIKSSTVFTTTTRGHNCSLSVATPTTFLPRKQMQSLRHAPHRLGPQDRPERRASIAVFSLRGDAFPVVVSFPLLLAGDIELNLPTDHRPCTSPEQSGEGLLQCQPTCLRQRKYSMTQGQFLSGV